MQNRLTQAAMGLVLTIGLFFILVWAKSLLIPLVIAIFLWYLLGALGGALQKAVPGGGNLPDWIFVVVALLLSAAGISLLFDAITESLSSITQAAPGYQENIRLRSILIDKELEIKILKDLLKKGDQRRKKEKKP